MCQRRLFSIAAYTLIGLTLLGACGGSSGKSTDASSSRTVDVDMRDIAYLPAHVSVHAGEMIKFVFHNRGKVAHDAFLGDEQAQMGHEQEMGSTGDMHQGGGAAITVAPAQTGSLTHTFRAGEQVLIGCHEPGHYTAGMKLTIEVS